MITELFDVRDYMWDVFEIRNFNNLLNIRSAFDMFIVNIELGQKRYDGADLNYYKLNKKWNMLFDFQKKHEIEIFNKIIDKEYIELLTMWRNNNKLYFYSLCKF